MQKTGPLVSIITPTYNRGDFITFAVESVLRQTYSDYEMIIVDDGSTDGTREIVGRYLHDKRIKYYRQKNLGQSTARNKGLNLSSGEYICFLDSDDIYKPGKLETQVSLFRRMPHVDIIYGDEEYIDTDGTLLGKSRMKCHSGLIYEALLLDNFVSITTAMVRRRCFDELGGFDESIKVADDYELWLRLSARYHFHYESVIFAQYRIMENQLSSDKNSRFESNRNAISKFLRENPSLLDAAGRRHVWCMFYIRTGRYKASIGELSAAMTDYKKAADYKITSVALWRAVMKYYQLKYFKSLA